MNTHNICFFEYGKLCLNYHQILALSVSLNYTEFEISDISKITMTSE